MNCPNCGCPNPDGRAYCSRCGGPLAVAPAGYYQPVQQAAVCEPPAVSALRRQGGSAMFLVLAILFSVSALFTLLTPLLPLGVTASKTADYYYVSGYFLSAIVGALPGLLIVMGAWMVYANCKSNRTRIKTGSFVLFKVAVIFIQVCEWIVACMVALVAFFYLLFGSTSALDDLFDLSVAENGIAHMGTYSSRKSNYGAEIFGVLVVCAILLAFLALGIVFTFKLLRVIRTMSYTAATGQPSDDIPSYAIVFCYIMGGLSALSCLKGLSALLTGGCLAAAYILLGVFLTRYRTEMRRVAYEVSISAAYPAGGIQPQAQPIDGYCVYCGSPLREIDAICSYCGAPRQN